ncbi:MAG: glutamate racemase [Candidatus Wallbacteria bacterium]|nr:glutamate racemase [Candidatus Wallbacteria bacterium]
MAKTINCENHPIGVFDSGLGGLTVYRELKKILPGEKFIYFGDTARVPYGNKSADTIKRYAFEISYFLARKGIKLLVVACNTVSAIALDDLQEAFRFPVVGVVQAGVELVAGLPGQSRVAVIGTTRAIKSRAYQTLLSQKLPAARIYGQPCPLFVPLIEEGLEETVLLPATLDHYLAALRRRKPDSLILGCTHYPLIEHEIGDYFGNSTRVINSGRAVAMKVAEVLGGARSRILSSSDEFYLTDKQANFQKISRKFLGFSIPKINIIRNSII